MVQEDAFLTRSSDDYTKKQQQTLLTQ
jgi:hypothetical protein